MTAVVPSVAPSHRAQPPAIVERFRRLYARPTILEVRGLGRSFESEAGTVHALHEIAFQAHRRELLCLIGPSGCGKSTLVRVLAGLDEPTAGEVLLDGAAVRGPGPDRGMVFQGYTLFPWRSVLENVMFGLEVAGKSKASAADEAMEWIEIVGLRGFVKAYPHQLSGGMKQRVAIARALANKPRILLMDEPFAALDAQTRAQMQSYLLALWKQIDITIVFVTHDLDEAVYLADRIVVLGTNPGHVREVVEVPLARPRNRDCFVDPLFVATKRHLESLIHTAPVPMGTEAEPVPLPRIRMTHVGDDVE